MPKKKNPRAGKNLGVGRRRDLKEIRKLFGDHNFSLEYAVLECLLQGYTANKIGRELARRYPELGVTQIEHPTVLSILKRALDHQVVQIKPPRLKEKEERLQRIYSRRSVRFYVADDSIGFLQARSMTRFFWSLAAEVINDIIADLVGRDDSGKTDEEIVVGNTGGLSASEAIKYLSRQAFDPEFLSLCKRRLCFLSLTAVGTSEHFDMHANYLAALLGNIYGGRHMAVMDPGDSPTANKIYDRRINSLRLLIGGVGAEGGYLRNWFTENHVAPPRGMIGDIFFHPIDAKGHLLEYDAKTKHALEPLKLRPTHQELWGLLNQAQPIRSLIIVTEPRRDGQLVDKSSVLDVALRTGFVTDCVLGSGLAQRLENLHPGHT